MSGGAAAIEQARFGKDEGARTHRPISRRTLGCALDPVQHRLGAVAERGAAGRQHVAGGPAAVVQLREGQTLELEDLRNFLRTYLSGYKLPRAITMVEEIPRPYTASTWARSWNTVTS